MNHRVNYPCHSKDASYDGANIDQELKEVLRILVKLDSNRREFVVKENHIVLAIVLSLMCRSQLIYLVESSQHVVLFE